MNNKDERVQGGSFMLEALTACIGTLVWVCVVGGGWFWLRGSGWEWLVPTVAGLLVVVLTVVAVRAHGRVRVAALGALPIAGDVRRGFRRTARRRGNRWLREAKLVPACDDKNYKCWLTKDNLRLENVQVVGITEHRLREAIAGSLNAWNCADYELSHPGNSVWDAALFKVARVEAIRQPVTVHESPRVVAGRNRFAVRIGNGLDGDAWMDFANLGGVLLAGDPGEGKSAALDLLLAGFLSHPDLVDVHLLNGKGDKGFDWARKRCVSYSNSTDFEFASAILELVWNTMETRNARSEENFWETFSDHPKDKAIVLVIDEAQTFISPSSPADKKTVAMFANRLTALVQKCRSAGIFVVLAMQRPTATSIPTDLRGILSQRVCFYVSSIESARAALGPVPEGEPLPVRPLLGPEDRGVAVRTTETGGTELVHFDYLPHGELRGLFPEPVRAVDSDNGSDDWGSDDWVIRDEED